MNNNDLIELSEFKIFEKNCDFFLFNNQNHNKKEYLIIYEFILQIKNINNYKQIDNKIPVDEFLRVFEINQKNYYSNLKKLKKKKEIFIIYLGAGDTGKSTFFKATKSKFGENF